MFQRKGTKNPFTGLKSSRISGPLTEENVWPASFDLAGQTRFRRTRRQKRMKEERRDPTDYKPRREYQTRSTWSSPGISVHGRKEMAMVTSETSSVRVISS